MNEASLSKRDIILNAAIKVFAERGYHFCRTLDISKEAGVAYGSLYHYFKSKDDILLSIFRERWKFLLAKMDRMNEEIDDPEARLIAVFDFIFRSYESYPDMMKVLIMDVPRLKQFYTPENWKLYNRFFTGVAEIFQEGQTRGIFNRQISPVTASFIFYGAVDTTIRQYVYNPEFNHDQYPIREVKRQIIALLKKGVMAKPNEPEKTAAEILKARRK
jgi:TetR/AcrR family fatty acid metabolism transcriptional regulator